MEMMCLTQLWGDGLYVFQQQMVPTFNHRDVDGGFDLKGRFIQLIQ